MMKSSCFIAIVIVLVLITSTTASHSYSYDDTPAEYTQTEDSPTEYTPAEDTPTEYTPTEYAPTEDSPTEYTPSEDTPTEYTPTEYTPAEYTPRKRTRYGRRKHSKRTRYGPRKHTYTPMKPSRYTPAKPSSYVPAKPTSYAPAKPTSYIPEKPVNYAPTKPTTSYQPAKPVNYGPTKPTTTYAPVKPVQAPATPVNYAPDKPTTTSYAPVSNNGLQDQFLAPQNAARAAVGLHPLVWDSTLATYAQWWADQRKYDCALEHSHGRYGENIFWGGGSGFTPSQAANEWVAERSNYNYGDNSCSGEMCGHYTQIVWGTTTKVGCAKADCYYGQGVFMVCSYDPPGNYVGQKPY